MVPHRLFRSKLQSTLLPYQQAIPSNDDVVETTSMEIEFDATNEDDDDDVQKLTQGRLVGRDVVCK